MKTKIYLLFIVALIAFLIYGVTTKEEIKYDPKAKRLDCQKEVISFEKIYKDRGLKEAIDSLKSGNFKLISKIEYSKFMKSKLLDSFDVEKLDEIVINSIQNITKKEQSIQENSLIIDYYLYENDKEDTNKKNEEAKLFAGFVVFEFKMDNKTTYKMQIDYKEDDTSDLSRRVDCAINSFLTSLN